MAEAMRDPTVEAEQERVKTFMLNELKRDARIRLYGIPTALEEKIPLFSFSVEHSHHEDIALILDKMGIAVRSGQMCAEPLMDRFGVTGMVRVSFAPYNTLREAEYFMESLDRAIKMLEG
jgi:cysteine desulfurase/selenocysteine lyase